MPRATFAKAPKIVNGDTVLNPDGSYVDADDPIDERAAFYLVTNLGHFFGNQQIGNGVIRVQAFTAAAEVETRDYVRRALRPLIESGEIENVRIEVTPDLRNGTAVNFYAVSYDKTRIVQR